MNFFHKADLKLPQWLENLVEGKIEKKASSTINDVFVPYGLTERASQVESGLIEKLAAEMIEKDKEELDFIKESEEPITVEKQDEEKKGDTSDIEKRIENAKTPEELEAIEKELSDSGDSEAAKPAGEAGEAPEAKPIGEAGEAKPAGEEETTKGEEETKPEEGSSNEPPNLDQLKDDVEDLKKEMKEVSKQETLEQQIKQLKKRLDNLDIQDDADLNDTIYQAASSKIKFVERLMKRGNLERATKILATIKI